jgi:magnesium chelatase family protein
LPVAALGPESMGASGDGEPSSVIAVRVAEARTVQVARQGCPNSHLSPRDIDRYCAPDAAGERLLHATARHLHWSARAYHRVLKVARTVADLAGSEHVAATHVAEAIGYRRALQRE